MHCGKATVRINPLLLNILCVINFVTSLTMPDLQSSDMRNIR